MSDETDPAAALHRVREAVVEAGFDQELQRLARRVWRSNLDRLEPDLGDTSRLLGLTCAENMTQLLFSALRDPRTRIDGVRASLTSGAVLIEMAGSRFRVLKAPFRSGLTPDWRRDFRWTPARPLRYEMAEANNRVFPATTDVAGLEPLLSAEDAGLVRDARDLHDYFFLWAGVPGSPPRTAGWIVTPTTAAPNFLATEQLWLDDADEPAASMVPPAPPSPDPEPELRLTVRRRPDAGVA